MPRTPLHPASGTGQFLEKAKKVIRFARYGCTNRPFYHIVVMHAYEEQKKPPIEQVGSYDPIPNFNNEKLVSFNYERIQHWIGKGAFISRPVARLLGLSGFLPIHPQTYDRAWKVKRRTEEKARQDAEKEAEAKTEASSG